MGVLQDLKPEPASPTERDRSTPYYRRDSVGSGLVTPSAQTSGENMSSSSGHGK